jgi:hypothetical protein
MAAERGRRERRELGYNKDSLKSEWEISVYRGERR